MTNKGIFVADKSKYALIEHLTYLHEELAQNEYELTLLRLKINTMYVQYYDAFGDVYKPGGKNSNKVAEESLNRLINKDQLIASRYNMIKKGIKTLEDKYIKDYGKPFVTYRG